MKAKMEIELRPFMVPNFVSVQRGGKPVLDESSIALADLDAETLDRLCDEFRQAVFKKAGKQPPIQNRQA